MPTMLYVPIDVAAKPMTGHAWVNYWWLCDKDKGLMWWYGMTMSDVKPQCNPDRAVVDNMLTRLGHDNCVAVFVPVVFEAHAVQELRSLRDQKRMFHELSKDWTT